MALLDAIGQRRARRAFAATPVPRELEAVLWEAVSLAPSHGNNQTTRLLVARSAAVRKALLASLSEGNQGWASAAPLLVAVAAVPSHTAPIVASDGSTRELWGFQAGIAAANLMAQATAEGLIAHPMAGFDEPTARAAFGAPGDVRLPVVFAIGYPRDPASLPHDLRQRETAPRERIPRAILVVEDRWSTENGTSARELRRRP